MMAEDTKSKSPKSEWRPVRGYEGRYEVSSLGEVRSLEPSGPRLLNQPKNKDGYLRVWFDGEHRYVHRLVLEAFVGPPHEKGALCIHKNGIRDDNVLSNLQWLSKAEAAVSRTGKHARFNHLTPDQVSEIRSSTASARELAEKFGVRPKTIIRVRRGETQPQKRTRLTSEQRATIVESEEPDNELAKKYGVSVRSIKQLRKEAAWRDVTHYRRLSPEEALQVLQSNESAEDLARRYGVATKSIQGIRSGRAHKKVYEMFQRMQEQQKESDDAK